MKHWSCKKKMDGFLVIVSEGEIERNIFIDYYVYEAFKQDPSWFQDLIAGMTYAFDKRYNDDEIDSIRLL